jgi:hypothetical protein
MWRCPTAACCTVVLSVCIALTFGFAFSRPSVTMSCDSTPGERVCKENAAGRAVVIVIPAAALGAIVGLALTLHTTLNRKSPSTDVLGFLHRAALFSLPVSCVVEGGLLVVAGIYLLSLEVPFSDTELRQTGLTALLSGLAITLALGTASGWWIRRILTFHDGQQLVPL